MAVTDAQVAALHAHLALDPDESERLHQQLVQAGAVAGYGELVSAAFVSAVRRRFAPAWTVSDVVKFVVAVRIRLHDYGHDIDPLISEVLIRQALGDVAATEINEQLSSRTQIVLLSELIFDENLNDAGLAECLAEARAVADRWLAAH